MPDDKFGRTVDPTSKRRGKHCRPGKPRPERARAAGSDTLNHPECSADIVRLDRRHRRLGSRRPVSGAHRLSERPAARDLVDRDAALSCHRGQRRTQGLADAPQARRHQRPDVVGLHDGKQ